MAVPIDRDPSMGITDAQAAPPAPGASPHPPLTLLTAHAPGRVDASYRRCSPVSCGEQPRAHDPYRALGGRTSRVKWAGLPGERTPPRGDTRACSRAKTRSFAREVGPPRGGSPPIFGAGTRDIPGENGVPVARTRPGAFDHPGYRPPDHSGGIRRERARDLDCTLDRSGEVRGARAGTTSCHRASARHRVGAPGPALPRRRVRSRGRVVHLAGHPAPPFAPAGPTSPASTAYLSRGSALVRSITAATASPTTRV